MSKSIKLRAASKKGIITVKALMNHPMETGLRKDKKTGKPIPAHYIQQVIAKADDKTVLNAVWGGAISRNPYLSFQYNGDKGGLITLSWMDNKGRSESVTGTVK